MNNNKTYCKISLDPFPSAVLASTQEGTNPPWLSWGRHSSSRFSFSAPSLPPASFGWSIVESSPYSSISPLLFPRQGQIVCTPQPASAPWCTKQGVLCWSTPQCQHDQLFSVIHVFVVLTSLIFRCYRLLSLFLLVNVAGLFCLLLDYENTKTTHHFFVSAAIRIIPPLSGGQISRAPIPMLWLVYYLRHAIAKWPKKEKTERKIEYLTSRPAIGQNLTFSYRVAFRVGLRACQLPIRAADFKSHSVSDL